MQYTKIDVVELKKNDSEKLQEVLQEKLETFKEQVKELRDQEELKALELDVDKDQEEFDEVLRKTEFDLSSGVDFEGKHYTQNDISKKIISFVNRMEQDFRYVTGLHGLVSFWKRQNDKVSFGVYDSTLRILGQLKYRGDSEWTDIMAVNQYLACAHEEYTKIQTILMYLATVRDTVVNQIKLTAPVNPDDTEVQGAEQ